MARLARLTDADAVRAAVTQFDELGRDTFLNEYGFGPARTYFLEIDGRLYDSKAVLAAAWGKQFGLPLHPEDFSGGEKTVATAFRRLGFTVRVVRPPWKEITRDSVTETLDEIDTTGVDAFLSRWGQNRESRYVIRRDAQTYPAKAVIAVAAAKALSSPDPLAPGDWPGNAATVAAPLTQLGFVVADTQTSHTKTTAAPSVFGELSGFPPGTPFANRKKVVEAGLHRHLQAGISGNPTQGADAIIVSGGYIDDQDFGDRLLYTGQGGRDQTGRQVADQTLTAGNLGLVNSELKGLPVRVLRGSEGDSQYSPASGYRYDGLYTVARHFVEESTHGPLIYRFELIRAEDADGATWANPATKSAPMPPPPVGTASPTKVLSTIQRLVRNTAVSEWVKARYDYACQFCGTRLMTGAGPYAEGAHIRPLGGKHQGADVPSNILCLCPNCHVRFDKGGLYIENHHVVDAVTGTVGATPITEDHLLDQEAIGYHRTHFVDAESDG